MIEKPNKLWIVFLWNIFLTCVCFLPLTDMEERTNAGSWASGSRSSKVTTTFALPFLYPYWYTEQTSQEKIIIWNLMTFLETIRKVTFIYTIYFFYVIQSHLCLYSQAYADGSQYMASHDNLSPPYSNSRLAGKRPHSLCLCVSRSLSLWSSSVDPLD